MSDYKVTQKKFEILNTEQTSVHVIVDYEKGSFQICNSTKINDGAISRSNISEFRQYLDALNDAFYFGASEIGIHYAAMTEGVEAQS